MDKAGYQQASHAAELQLFTQPLTLPRAGTAYYQLLPLQAKEGVELTIVISFVISFQCFESRASTSH